MKKLRLLLLALTCSIILNAQITEVNVFNTSDLRPTCASFIELENSGIKYFWYDHLNWTLKIYNSDHSIYKLIVVDNSSLDVTNYPNIGDLTISCISENLFDTDDDIEFLLSLELGSVDENSSLSRTIIVDSDGTIIFNKLNQVVPTLYADSYMQQFPSWIRNTPDGIQMILFEVQPDFDSEATGIRVYKITGTLPTTTLKSLKSEFDYELEAFPNPANEYSIIKYKIPQEIQNAEIVIYNMNGIELKRYQIDSTFDNLRLSTAELSKGTYLYSVLVNEVSQATKKLLVIK